MGKTKEKTLFEQFDEQVAQHNANIEYYREFVPKAKPLIEEYKDYFNSITINETGISLTPKDEDKIPPMFFCKMLENGILAKEHISSYSGGFGGVYRSCTIQLVLNKC